MKHERLSSVIAWQHLGAFTNFTDITPTGLQNIKYTAGQKDAFGVDLDMTYTTYGLSVYYTGIFGWQVYMRKVGAPTGTLVAAIYDYLTGALLWTLGTVDVSTLGGGNTAVYVVFGRRWDDMVAYGKKVTVGVNLVDTSADHVNNYVQVLSDGAGTGLTGLTMNLRTYGNAAWDKVNQKIWSNINTIYRTGYKYDPSFAWLPSGVHL